jgi:hypothetical protein
MTSYIFAAKILLAASVIGYASWLSDKKPVLAGFIVALPLVSILAKLSGGLAVASGGLLCTPRDNDCHWMICPSLASCPNDFIGRW